MLLTDPSTGGLQYPMAAHYSMLRTALESAAQAVWLIAPADADLRRRRSLICRWSEVNYDDAAAVAALADDPDDTTEKHRAKVKNLKPNRQEINSPRQQAPDATDLEAVCAGQLSVQLAEWSAVVHP